MSWLTRLLTRRRTAIPPAERLTSEWERINARVLAARDAEGDHLEPSDLDAGIPAVASNAPAVKAAGAPSPDGTSQPVRAAAPEPRPGSPTFGLDSLPGPRGGTPSNDEECAFGGPEDASCHDVSACGCKTALACDRCDRCRHRQYRCPDCDERAYERAGQLSVEREMRARSMKAARYWKRR